MMYKFKEYDYNNHIHFSHEAAKVRGAHLASWDSMHWDPASPNKRVVAVSVLCRSKYELIITNSNICSSIIT